MAFMKRSFREIIELGVIGAFAITAVNGLLWVFGHALRLIGLLGKYVIIATSWLWSNLIMYILIFTVLVIIIFLVVRRLLNRHKAKAISTSASNASVTVAKNSSNNSSNEDAADKGAKDKEVADDFDITVPASSSSTNLTNNKPDASSISPEPNNQNAQQSVKPADFSSSTDKSVATNKKSLEDSSPENSLDL